MNLEEKIRAKRDQKRETDREIAQTVKDRRTRAKAKTKMIDARVSPYGLRAYFNDVGTWTIEIYQLDFLGFKKDESEAYVFTNDHGDYLDKKIEGIIVNCGKTSSFPSSPFIRIPLILAAVAIVLTVIF